MNLKKILLATMILALVFTTNGYVNNSFSATETVSVESPVQFYVQHRPDKSVSPAELSRAKLLADILVDYPVSGVEQYSSLKIFTTSNGKQQKATGNSLVLTTDQKRILGEADMSSVINIYLAYKTRSTVSDKVEDGEMTVKIAVRPETEAKYDGGMDKLVRYLQENSEAKVKELSQDPGFVAIVNFAINEEGKADNIAIAESTDHNGIGHLLEKLLVEMPVWTPAKDAIGNVVSQDFEFVFRLGTDGGC